MNEVIITQFFNHLGHGTIVDSISKVISSDIWMIIFFLVIVALAFYYDKKDRKTILIALFIAVILHFAITDGLMKGIGADYFGARERPYLAYPNQIIPLGSLSTDSSFPSGHVAGTVALLTVIIYFYRKYWPVGIVITLLMMFSRIHNGMHYPSDVIAGVIFGFAYGAVGIWIAKKIIVDRKKKRKK